MDVRIPRDAPGTDRAASATGPPKDVTDLQPRLFSLRGRLLALVVLLLLPWLALVLYTQVEERSAAIAAVNRDQALLIRIVTSNQAGQIEAARQLLAALARVPQLSGSDEPSCRAFLAQMLAASPMYVNFGVIQPNGSLTCSALPLPSAIDVSDRGYFRAAMRTRRFTVGDYQIGRITLLPAINYAQPILGPSGEVRAVVYAAQSLNWLTLALAQIEFPHDTVLFVTDRNGTVLARMPNAQGLVGKSLPESEVLAVLSRQKDGGVFEADDAQGTARLWATAPLIEGLDLHATIGVSKTALFADIDRRLIRNLLALGAVTVLAMGAAWFGGAYILRQVGALVMATGKLRSGDLGVQAAVVGDRSELELLAHAFNDMSTTLAARDRELRLAEQKARTAEVELAVTRAHMEIARQIQSSLVPQVPLAVSGMKVAGRCVPAEAVGGDYFGYFPRETGGIDSFVGDVSGHGVGAALLMAEARITFLTERLVEPGAAGILTRLNDLLHDDLDHAGHFMTACCATFDAVRRELAYANAGHPPALLLRADQSVCTALEAEGMLLGVDTHIDFRELKVSLREGDIVVFYTDGVTEARNALGEPFGRARLENAVLGHRAVDPDAALDGILAELDRFVGTAAREDDVTIVLMKLSG